MEGSYTHHYTTNTTLLKLKIWDRKKQSMEFTLTQEKENINVYLNTEQCLWHN
jgi:hypothetical protein